MIEPDGGAAGVSIVPASCIAYGSRGCFALDGGRRLPIESSLFRQWRGLGSLMGSELASPTILVVEDEALVRDLLVVELREAGYQVVSADTGEKALAILQDRTCTRNVDWLFTDIRLPGVIDGWRV